MTQRTIGEERLARWFEEQTTGEQPHRALQAAFTRIRTTPQDISWKERLTTRTSRRLLMLAAAALLVVGGAAAYVGSSLLNPRPDLLTRVELASSVRIAVRPDFPQVVGQTIGLAGFDVDVANELARRLSLKAEVQTASASQMLGASVPADILLPSVGTGAIDPSRFARSVPYYWWPHFLVVTAASGRSTVSDLAGQPICAVQDDVGESWLRGDGGSSPIDGSLLVLHSSDAECLQALDDGEVAAVVTAQLGPADLKARPGLVVLHGPPSEPRVITAALADQPGSLMADVDSVLGEMFADGTLSTLSKNRFGGYDLSRAPAE
jgi:cystine transport system substrate-binding protein